MSGTRKIFIAVPTYSGEINCHTTISLARAVAEAKEQGWEAEISVRPLDSLLPRCRNAMLTDFLKSDATDLIFWDADIACAPGNFTRLISHEQDIVGGAYRARSDPERYIFRQLPGPLEPEAASGLIEVEGLGAGFLKITRAAVDRMIAAYPDLWINDRASGRLVWLFDFELRDHEYFSEDFIFCLRWRACGGSVWIDPELHLHHTGAKTFSGSFGDFQRRQRAAAVPQSVLDAARKMLDEADLSGGDGIKMMMAAE